MMQFHALNFDQRSF